MGGLGDAHAGPGRDVMTFILSLGCRRGLVEPLVGPVPYVHDAAAQDGCYSDLTQVGWSESIRCRPRFPRPLAVGEVPRPTVDSLAFVSDAGAGKQVGDAARGDAEAGQRGVRGRRRERARGRPTRGDEGGVGRGREHVPVMRLPEASDGEGRWEVACRYANRAWNRCPGVQVLLTGRWMTAISVVGLCILSDIFLMSQN